MRKFSFLFILISCFLVPNVQAQIEAKINPQSFLISNQDRFTEKIPEIKMPLQNNQKLLSSITDNKEKPWQFGKNIETHIDFRALSQRTQVTNGNVFRLQIKSKNATSLNLNFSEFYIPNGATLHIYSQNRKQIIGAFTSKNNQKNRIFATTLLQTDCIILEYFEPFDADFSGILIINRVTHGFRNTNEYFRGFQDSGTCNKNVACDDGLPWSDEIRSVCAIVVNNAGFCTGTLINNANEDEIPYLLTANHCYSDPSSWIFWFNWQSDNCANPIASPSKQSISGAVLKARNSASDFCLVEINTIPPLNYAVFYAGWDRSGEPASSAVCIHHPYGDIKKISFNDDSIHSSDYMPNPYLVNSHWEVGKWDRQTTTEPGSSGSALFDQNHHLIGQLHGGWASCNSYTQDYFGKFSISWDGGDTQNNRLKEFLDPNNTGIPFLDGFDPNQPKLPLDIQLLAIQSPQKLLYSKSIISPSVVVRNRGSEKITNYSLYYILDGIKYETLLKIDTLLTNETVVATFPLLKIPFGLHTISFFVEKPNNLTDQNLNNNTLTQPFELLQQVFFEDFEKDTTWELTGEFEIAPPKTFSNCCNPETAFSGQRMLGSDLTGKGKRLGNYEESLGYKEYSATSPVINCKGFQHTELHFMRRIGIEESDYDHAYLQINNGNGWEILWQNEGTENETIWTRQRIDISQYADNRQVQIQFSLGQTDDDLTFCGWNVDDLAITGEPYVYSSIQTKVYPNPSNGIFEVALPKGDEQVTFSIFSVIGKLIYKDEKRSVPDSNILPIEVPFLLKGCYFLKIETKNKVSTVKFLVN